MKVGVVIARYRRTGGLERVAVEWARGLHERGHDVVVFAQTVLEPDPGITFAHVGGAKSPGWLRAATFPFAAARAIRSQSCDVVCSFGAAVDYPTVMGTAGPHRAWFEQGTAEASVFTYEGVRRRLNPHHRVVMSMERRIVGGGRYERVFATSQASAADFSRLYSVPKAKLGVLENGVNFHEFRIDAQQRADIRKQWNASDRPVVLSLSNEVSRKGVDTLIQAFPVVLESVPDAVLVVAGPIATQARRLAHAARIDEKALRIIGPVRDSAAAFNGADVFAFPTRYDPWGLVAIESLACGTPVVCGSSAGVVDHLRDGETAIVVEDVRSPAALARAIVDGLALRASREALRASVAHLAWPNIVDRVEQVLREVVASRKAQVPG